MDYRERPSTVDGAVVWTRVADGSDSWILPDGCMDLIWDGGALFVAGPDTGPALACAAAGTQYTAIRFAPGTGPSVLGVPADQMRNQRIALDALWARSEVARVVEQIDAADDVAQVLESVSAARLREVPADPLLAEIVRLVEAGHPIGDVAETVGFSCRQLHRRSLVAFGYGPKVLARILRLQQALALARGGSLFAKAAADAGYADQAHLAREVRALAGAPLTELV